ncbi:hypothetical protein AtubIFM55763_000136 [Aspergillus tubingensis]|uniref:Uncharacterized protein n=2 Tax=Aspergillus subgen. Circumdati TaxID=2720871 RepID=A0A8H3Y0C2_ASPTU|nr:methyltransferase domain family protein [Aspergillus tubingensis]GAQ39355.1 similar to An07g05420 [Aspergillus niger]GFN17885.1 methyltransferase domain family protein [Aspergillus tubingensis]GLA64769.1 hypothetical protein AtubIFM54640_006496 [Aspergillus tubingensis]GLA67884.1 hypothetical protein AtubIFM55763_000136 [Aspergillus tubingensis]GLA83548.1 hypothetical protein AtubIFM56815_007750 [Aspergillus tubingensis]
MSYRTTSSSSSAYSSYSSSTSNDNNNPRTESTGHRYATTSHTDPTGATTVRTGYQNLGQEPVFEERRFDSAGREAALLDTQGGMGAAGGTRAIRELDEDADEGEWEDGTY